LIGFIDDYSRYITGLGFHRSQTAEHVLENYRKAVGEYGVPKEMLTDNGRQYTSWRGSTRFEKELKKDRVKHIRSRPHHPMTLGKIERFWKTILNEFLFRAQFDSFEEALERVNLWVKYYNYKRPHQGIGGVCPADRFFEIQHELKKTLEKGVAENTLEMALRGKPQDPFYMVGRMGGQSVVIRAEKGKVKMLVDGQKNATEKELVYDIRKENTNEDNQTDTQKVQHGRQSQGGIVDLDGAPERSRNLQGNGRELVLDQSMAGYSHGGDDDGTVTQETRKSGGIGPPSGEAFDQEAVFKRVEPVETGGSTENNTTEEKEIIRGDHGAEETGISPEQGRDYHESPLRPDDSNRSSQSVGCIPKDLL